MKILLDCDVLLDVATGRTPFVTDSRAAVKWVEQHPGSGYMAWHTIANVYFRLRKASGDGAAARQFIRDLLAFVEVVPTGTAAAKYALTVQMTDFEDALQSAAAVQAGLDFIVTRNIRDYRSSPVPAILPGDFLAQAPA